MIDDRAAAIEILQRAKELLAERLTERILESRDEILGDALGMSYQSEIDAIYEHIGAKLQHVGAMLANLPERKTKPVAAPVAAPEPPAPLVTYPSLPAPKPVAGLLPAQCDATTFRTFVTQIQAGNVAGAGSALSELFQLEPRRAQQCAAAFFTRFQARPEIILKAIRLRSELTNGRTNQLLMLLWECFGLEGGESLNVLQKLQTRLAG